MGEFRVDEAGQATYNIPIYVPPGTAGVQPKLSLVYNSGGGPGALGKGWNLSGLSVISRCRASREAGDFIVGGAPVDGDPNSIAFRQQDRFCMDGQRLILVSTDKIYGDDGAEYRLESDRFTRVYSRGGLNPPEPTFGNPYTGPNYFEVQRKDGSTSTYGNTVDSYIDGNGPGFQSAAAWAMNRMQDSTGNYIDYGYEENFASNAESEFVAKTIKYTGKISPAQMPYATITFNYDTVALRDRYAGGSRATRTRRLASIDVAGMRWYKLTYQTSASGTAEDTLTAVKECSDSTESICYPATTFAWSGAAQNYSTTSFRTDTGLESLIDHRLGDVDGDGRLDLVYVRDTGGSGCASNEINVRFAVRSGTGALTFPRITGQPSICTGHASSEISRKWQLLDYDGDGRDDLLIAEAQGQGGNPARWRVRPAIGRMGFDTSRDLLNETGVTLNVSDVAAPEIADFNGDGLPDILSISNAGVTSIRYLERVGTTATFKLSLPYVFNAQAQIPSGYACRTGSTPSCTVGIYTFGELRPQDYDGDGRADIVAIAIQDPVELPANRFVTADDLRGAGTPFFLFLLHTRDRVDSPQRTQNLEFWWSSYDGGPSLPASMPKWIAGIGDFNGDGLPDFLGTNGDFSLGYQVCKNPGAKTALVQCSGSLLTNLIGLKVADVNGDGRNDLLHFNTTSNSTWQNYQVRYAGLDGMFGTTSTTLPGNGTQGIVPTSTSLPSSRDIFADLDGDAAPDFLALYPVQGADNERTGTGDATVRFKPKDVITEITSGYGAKTTISYLPLTNNTVYTKDIGSRNDADPTAAGVQIYGRGSPVLDLMMPMYVVSHVQSDAPVWGNAASRSLVSYRYVGAKMQAGGRGMLGFREIISKDHNYTGTPAGHVVSKTIYSQAFPFVGLPTRSEKWVVAGQATPLGACRASGLDADACTWTYGQAPPTLTGSLIQVADTTFDTIPDFGSGAQAPLFTYPLVTQERRYALPLAAGVYGVSTGTLLSYVATGECGHDAWGNPGLVGIDTHAVDPFASAPSRSPTGAIPCAAPNPSYDATVQTRKRTVNTWEDPGQTWQLGRLALAEVQHSRRNADGFLITSSRFAQFNYQTSGVTKGLLKDERVEPGALAANDELRAWYQLDPYGNRTGTYTCSADVDEIACRNPMIFGDPLLFHPPADVNGEPSTSVRRYSRTTFDTIGRYPTAGYEPYFNPSATEQWSEHASWSQCVLPSYGARDEFGELQCLDDANGVTAKSRRGSFGREYWAWSEGTSGTATGVETTITYAWCSGSHGGTASCPTGAVFRRQVVNTVAATGWSYFDVLGREIAAATQSFNDAGAAGVSISIVCGGFDAHGRAVKSTEPRFMTGTFVGAPDFAGQTSICTAAPASSQTTTVVDVIGRATKVTAPDAGETTSTYDGLTTTIRAPCNNEGTAQLCTREWTEIKNASGEPVIAMDPNGFMVHYERDEFGNVEEVRRDAGSGDIVNSAVFDVRGRKTQQSDTDGGTWSFVYNAAGEMVKRTDARGQTVRMDIDARGRVWRTRASFTPGGACPDCLFANGFEASSASTSGITEDLTQYDTAANGLGMIHWDTRTAGGATTISRTYAYDALTRPLTKITQIEGKNYTERTAYDSYGRLLKSLTEYTENYPNPNGAYAYSEGAEYTYGVRGHLERVCRAVDATSVASGCPSNTPGAPIYWRLISQDARGQVTQDERHESASLRSTRTYNSSTGRLATLKSGSSDGLQNLVYAYDLAGNLLRREDYRGGTKIEAFKYDALDRVIESRLNSQLLMSLNYDDLGNICSKTGSPYIYAGRSGCAGALEQADKSAHAVTQAFGISYYYDANGLQVRADDTTGTANDRYTEYDAHHRMTGVYVGTLGAPSFAAEYAYAPDLSLVTQIELNATNQPTRRTHYVGNLEWTDRNPGGSANREARLNLPGGLILVKHFLDGKAPTTDYRYVFTDVLGSVDVIANETGTVVERMSFDVHGRRRSEINWTTPITYGFDATTRKGYTGHEQIDGAGLVHMRARMYDPRLGRFIQPDPMVESDATQGWNRYSYVLNNPMSATDPTGMLTQRQAVRAGRTIAAIVVSIALPQAGFWAGTAFEGFGAFVVSGFVAGGISGGWQGAIWGAFSAGTFQAVGAAFPGTPGVPISQAVGKTAYWHKVLAHGTAGGVLNTLQGGKFGHGFVSNGIMEAASPGIRQLDTVHAQTFTAALVGGTVSDLTGGNFGNGALTSAFAWAFNHTASKGRVKIDLAGAPDNFANQVDEMIQHLGDDGQNILDRITGAGYDLYIKYSEDTFDFVTGTIGSKPFARIYADPLSGLSINGLIQSPVISLYHELVHVERVVNNLVKTSRGRANDKEERNVIMRERALAVPMGEPVRVDHSTGKAVRVKCPICRE
ncbi:MAG: VCBS repeat-containing protein [Xanthomonadales bacterium]|nr:VCBS repeat-containing protein [Xanthomonadales bacterium]MCB1613341.1 VCBS repeat-containing protein [Xanthomonadales bacterium]